MLSNACKTLFGYFNTLETTHCALPYVILMLLNKALYYMRHYAMSRIWTFFRFLALCVPRHGTSTTGSSSVVCTNILISWNILQEISTLEYFTPDHSFQFGKRKQNTNRLYPMWYLPENVACLDSRVCPMLNIWYFRVYSEFLRLSLLSLFFIPHFWFLTVFLKNDFELRDKSKIWLWIS